MIDRTLPGSAASMPFVEPADGNRFSPALVLATQEDGSFVQRRDRGMTLRSALRRLIGWKKSAADIATNAASLRSLVDHLAGDDTALRARIEAGLTRLPGDGKPHSVADRIRRGTFVSNNLIAQIRTLHVDAKLDTHIREENTKTVERFLTSSHPAAGLRGALADMHRDGTPGVRPHASFPRTWSRIAKEYTLALDERKHPRTAPRLRASILASLRECDPVAADMVDDEGYESLLGQYDAELRRRGRPAPPDHDGDDPAGHRNTAMHRHRIATLLAELARRDLQSHLALCDAALTRLHVGDVDAPLMAWQASLAPSVRAAFHPRWNRDPIRSNRTRFENERLRLLDALGERRIYDVMRACDGIYMLLDEPAEAGRLAAAGFPAPFAEFAGEFHLGDGDAALAGDAGCTDRRAALRGRIDAARQRLVKSLNDGSSAEAALLRLVRHDDLALLEAALGRQADACSARGEYVANGQLSRTAGVHLSRMPVFRTHLCAANRELINTLGGGEGQCDAIVHLLLASFKGATAEAYGLTEQDFRWLACALESDGDDITVAVAGDATGGDQAPALLTPSVTTLKWNKEDILGGVSTKLRDYVYTGDERRRIRKDPKTPLDTRLKIAHETLVDAHALRELGNDDIARIVFDVFRPCLEARHTQMRNMAARKALQFAHVIAVRERLPALAGWIPRDNGNETPLTTLDLASVYVTQEIVNALHEDAASALTHSIQAIDAHDEVEYERTKRSQTATLDRFAAHPCAGGWVGPRGAMPVEMEVATATPEWRRIASDTAFARRRDSEAIDRQKFRAIDTVFAAGVVQQRARATELIADLEGAQAPLACICRTIDRFVHAFPHHTVRIGAAPLRAEGCPTRQLDKLMQQVSAAQRLVDELVRCYGSMSRETATELGALHAAVGQMATALGLRATIAHPLL